MHRLLLISCLLILYQSIAAHPAYGIVMDHAGNLYFTDIFHNGRGTLWKLDRNKKLTAVFKDFHAHNVNIDQDGNIYSAHGEETHNLLRLSPEGQIDTIVSTKDMNIFFGGSCTVGHDGKVYFGIDKKIWLWTPSHREAINSMDLKWNQGFYVDKAGTIYATDIGRGKGGSLIEIKPDGSSRIIAEQLIDVGERDFDPTSEVLLGVTKDENSNLYVCDLGGKRIARIIPEGEVNTHYKSEEGWMPCGIYFKGKEEFILEYGKGMSGPRIVKKLNDVIEIYFEYEAYNRDINHTPPPSFRKGYYLTILLLIFGIVSILVGIKKYGKKTLRFSII